MDVLANGDRFKEWCNIYGNIISVKIGGSTLIVLNDRKAVHDLIE